MSMQGCKGQFTRAGRSHRSIVRPSIDEIQSMVDRFTNGEDLWTGEPLIGDDADNWIRVQDGTPEEDPKLTPRELAEIQAALLEMAWNPFIL